MRSVEGVGVAGHVVPISRKRERAVFKSMQSGKSIARILGVLALVASAPEALESQTITGYAVGYVDGDETGLGLLGAQVRPGGFGLQPVGSLEAFVLGYPGPLDEQTSLWSISPGAGIHYAAPNGAFSARGGYQFVLDEEIEDAPFFAGGESGPFVTVQGQYWGMTPIVEALANYNFTSSFLWTQAQAYLPVFPVPPGSIDLGAEYIFQGDLDDDDSRAQLFGPLVRWATGTGAFVFVSGGMKNNLGPADNTWYGRATVVVEVGS